MKQDNILIVLGLVIILLVCSLPPYFEMKAFNRLSDKKVTYWEAFFLDLRVEATGG